MASLIKLEAYNIHRVFPEKELSYKDIINFIKDSISFIRVSNALILSFIVTMIGLLVPYLNQSIYDRLIPADDYVGIYGVCTLLISILIGSACFSLVKGFLSLGITSKLKYSLQIAFFDRIFKLKQSFIQKFEPADLSMRVLGISNIFTLLTTKTFATIITFVFSMFYLVQMNTFMPSLVMPAIGITLVIFCILIIFSRIQYK